MKKVLVLTAVLSLAFAAQANVGLEKSNANELSVVLNADSDIYGLQFDLNYDAQEIKLSETDINHMFSSNDLRSSMSVYSKIKEPGLARVIMFDISGQPIVTENTTENVLSIAFEALDVANNFSISINNIVAAGLHGEEINISTNEVYDFNSTDDMTQPTQTQLYENYPNPFNPVTNINFNLNDANQGDVNIKVFDMTGREVADLHSGWLSAGYHQFSWDAGNMASGNYFAVVSAPGFTDRIKMTLIK